MSAGLEYVDTLLSMVDKGVMPRAAVTKGLEQLEPEPVAVPVATAPSPDAERAAKSFSYILKVNAATEALFLEATVLMSQVFPLAKVIKGVEKHRTVRCWDILPNRLVLVQHPEFIMGKWNSTALSGLNVTVDTCEIYTQTDLAGWISYLKSEIAKTAINTLAFLFDDRDVMPQGMTDAVQKAKQGRYLLHSCGFDDETITTMWAKHMEPILKHLWETPTEDAAGTKRFLLRLRPSPGSSIDGRKPEQGLLVGRRKEIIGRLTVRFKLPLPRGEAMDWQDHLDQGGKSEELTMVTYMLEKMLEHLAGKGPVTCMHPDPDDYKKGPRQTRIQMVNYDLTPMDALDEPF